MHNRSFHNLPLAGAPLWREKGWNLGPKFHFDFLDDLSIVRLNGLMRVMVFFSPPERQQGEVMVEHFIFGMPPGNTHPHPPPSTWNPAQRQAPTPENGRPIRYAGLRQQSAGTTLT